MKEQKHFNFKLHQSLKHISHCDIIVLYWIDGIRDFQPEKALLLPGCAMHHIPALWSWIVPKVEMHAKSVSAGGMSRPWFHAMKKENIKAFP